MKRLSASDFVALACCLFYFCLGSAWIYWPGLQADEVLFTQPLFAPGTAVEYISVFHHPVPLMLMSYLGCLKTLLYAPLLWLFDGAQPQTMTAVIRLPAVALGALTIWLFYRIIAKMHSERAGAIVAVLLASDTLYLLLSRCDWGPVTLQHVLAGGGVWMLLRFRDSRRAAWLAAGFFAFGLALWDKTVFLWPAAALLMGLALMWREIAPLVTARRIALALACFALGAFPWVRYNVRQHGATFQETGHFTLEGSWEKAENFVGGLNGRMLLGYLIAETGSREMRPSDAVAGTMVGLAKVLGFPRQSIAGWVFVAALLASPFLGRASRIAAAMLLAGFALMAITKGGGQWPYHSSVLWPLPHIVMALALVRLPKPWLVSTVAVIALTSLAVTNTHFARLHQYGGSTIWSDAIYRLPAAIERHAVGMEQLKTFDWGILEPVQLLTRGRLPLRWRGENEPVVRGALYVGHVHGSEVFTESNAALIEGARRAGCSLRPLETVADRLGTPVFLLQICN